MEIYYSDIVQIVMRPYDAKIIFGVVDPAHKADDRKEVVAADIVKYAAVYMSLTQIKVLLTTLEKSIAQHEKAVGKIKVPDQIFHDHKTLQ